MQQIVMKISFIRELQAKIRSDCDICGKHRLLEYLVMNEKNEMFSICLKCKEDLLKDDRRLED